MTLIVRATINSISHYLWSPNGSCTRDRWHMDQRGAWRFTDRGEAHRQAYAAAVALGRGVVVRVVRLRPKARNEGARTT